MAGRRKYKRKGRKKPYRKRRSKSALYRYKGRGYTISKTPFPTVFITQLKYIENGISYNPAIGGIDTNVYRATSIVSPNSTHNHQPRYFDQLMSMYDHYVVLGAKITCQFFNTDTSNSAVVSLGIFDDGSPLSTQNDYMENKHARYKVMGSRDSATSKVTLRGSYSPRFLGKNNPINSKELKGTLTTNPDENAYFHVVVAGLPESIDLGNVRSVTQIIYTVAFVEPNSVAQSV